LHFLVIHQVIESLCYSDTEANIMAEGHWNNDLFWVIKGSYWCLGIYF